MQPGLATFLPRRVLAGVIVTAAIVACTPAERPANGDHAGDVASMAAANGSVSLPATGEWRNGDEHLTWSTTARDSLTEVQEQVTFGSDGTARRTLLLSPRGTLERFTESRTQTAQATDRSPTRMQVELTLEFAGDSAVRRTKTVDGAPAPVRDYEVAAARKHVADLLATFGATRPTPSSRN